MVSLKVKEWNGKQKLKNHTKQRHTIGPLHTIGASFSTKDPIDIHLTPWFSIGIILLAETKVQKTNTIIM